MPVQQSATGTQQHHFQNTVVDSVEAHTVFVMMSMVVECGKTVAAPLQERHIKGVRGRRMSTEEVIDEAESAKRQRQREIEITSIVDRLRDLNVLIDTRMQNEYKFTGREGGNRDSSDVRICVEDLWDISEIVQKGELVKTYTRNKMTSDKAIYLIEGID